MSGLEIGWHQLGLILLCAANLGLGILVLLHDYRAQTNRLFFFTVLVVVGWISSISLALWSNDLRQTVVLGRIGFAFAAIMPFALLRFSQTFGATNLQKREQWPLIPTVLCTLFAGLSLSPWLVSGAAQGLRRPDFVYGPLHPLFGAYLITCFAYAIYRLWRTTQAASGITKVQLRYLVAGVLLSGIGILITNLLVPLAWKTSYYSVIGPYFTLTFVSFSAHAIIRYRLMDVKFFVRKGVVYVCAISIASLVFLATATLIMRLSGHTAAESIPLTAALAIAVMIAISFQPLKRWIQDSFNQYLYRETYDYQRTVREVSRRLGTILDLQTLLDYLTDTIERLLRCESVKVYLADDQRTAYLVHTAKDRTPSRSKQPATLSAGSPLARFLRKEARALVRDEARRTNASAKEAAQELWGVGGEIAFPFFDDNSLSGILIAGPKLSGDPYFPDDIDLVSTLASQAAIAMKNAQLYRQVLLANEHIENIIETMESAVIAVTAQGTVTLFNSAAERLTGLKADYMKGRSTSDLPDTVSQPIRATLMDGIPRLQIETFVRNNAGDLCPAIYSTSTLKDRSEAILGIVAVFSDLTKLKELEAEKRRTERLASIGAFVSGIAHEIKNPLVAIKTFAELLPERFTDEDFRHEFSKVAIREIERIDELVRRLRGLVTPQPQDLNPVDLRDPIEETLSLLRGQLEQARIRVTTHYNAPGILVAADGAQLKQLFLNVLLNAVEAMPNGGEIGIRLDERKTGQASTLLVEIQDSGVGIPQHLLGAIFDPFITTKPHGSGLGLSICRGIAETHRASITAQNNINGVGATIILEFPVMQ